MAHRETLLSVSSVYLFGRLVTDLKVAGAMNADDENRPGRGGANNFLEKQVRNDDAALARIYAFSFEGAIYDLDRPSLFIVHGEGQDPEGPGPADRDLALLGRSPGRVTKTGVARQSAAFSRDMRVWIYDKSDFSVRLDVETGSFEHILLAAELGDDGWSSGGRSGSGRSGRGRSGSGRSGRGLSSGVLARSDD